MASLYLYVLGIAFAVVTVSYYALNDKQRALLLSRFGLDRQHKLPWSPQQSPSVTKNGLSEKSTLPTGQGFKDTLPPSRRPALADLTDSRFSVGGKSGKGLSEIPHNTDKSLPDNCNVLAPQYKKYSTPTGFTVEEIKALGNFPDYATLSGVSLPATYTDFDIKTAMSRPYRPFQWSDRQKMSHQKLEPNWWLELDKTYISRIKQRQDLYAKHGSAIIQSLPGSEIACKELMEMVLQFLSARYPSLFSIDTRNLTFRNNILYTTTDLREKDPLEVLLDNVPEDFAIMLRDPHTGYYSFRAGVICSSPGWSLGTKLGKGVKEIHEGTPDYKESMEFSMDSKFFAELATDKPIQRGSWDICIDEPLFSANDTNPPNNNQNPSSFPLSRTNLRVGRQTLRRLPLSGAVALTSNSLFTPIASLASESYIPALLSTALKERNKEDNAEKSVENVVVLPALEEMDRAQKQKGVMEQGWEVKTLEQYPWFPGWEDKWQKEQGFA